MFGHPSKISVRINEFEKVSRESVKSETRRLFGTLGIFKRKSNSTWSAMCKIPFLQ